MNFKFQSLYSKVYSDFVKGVYEYPVIPTREQVIAKMNEITSPESVPILTNEAMKDIDIDTIHSKFENIVDDIDVLFSSVEHESREVLDQLTNSLKEHNGTKRELRKIRARVDDISNGTIGEEYLKYSFTENFDDVSNIATYRSDPINTEAGVFTIQENSSNNVSMYHYSGKKLEFSIVETYTQIVDYGYVGVSDSATVLDPNDPRQLVYRIRTSSPTRLRTAFSVQLNPDAEPVDINSVAVNVDSDISQGFIRLYVRTGNEWKDPRGVATTAIKNDKVRFDFPTEQATHIKVEFIKDTPDVPDTNEYFYVINDIAVKKAHSQSRAVLYSRPIQFDAYSNEIPIVDNVSVVGDYQIPKNCTAKLYVSQDIRVSGAFTDSTGSPVNVGSASAVQFSPTTSGFVYLSDIMEAQDSVSGIGPYKSLDYNWVQMQLGGEEGSKLPKVVSFGSTKKNPSMVNSMYTVISNLLWGDPDYSGTYALYSGWCNSDHPNWLQLEPYVTSGILVSGINLATVLATPYTVDAYGNLHPDILADARYSGQYLGAGIGYPYNYYHPSFGRVIRFGDYDKSEAGWWRPFQAAVTPTGISSEYTNELNPTGFVVKGLNMLNPETVTNLPDFYFNNIKFYKIYRFGYDKDIIDPSIKMYLYQERPTRGEDGYYPHNFIWEYKSAWINETSVKKDQFAPGYASFSGYVIPVGNLRINEDYIFDGVSEVKIHNTNSILDDSEYIQLRDANDVLSGIEFSPLTITREHLKPQHTTFDYKYHYRIKDKYLSTWTGYAIVDSASANVKLTVINDIINRGVPDDKELYIVDKIIIEDIDTGDIFDSSKATSSSVFLQQPDPFEIKFPVPENARGDSHFKITIFCGSDENSGFSAKKSDGTFWVPTQRYEESGPTLIVTPGIRIVSRLKPMAVTDISKLLYDTSAGSDADIGIYDDAIGEKWLVAKTPSKDSFPGYYYNTNQKRYIVNEGSKIINKGHWVRRGSFDPGSGELITYTTGSSGNVVFTPQADPSVIASNELDWTWNYATTIPSYPNTSGNIKYPLHSTYGYAINIDDLPDLSGSMGFLFYDSGENLPTAYSISYRSVDSSNYSTKRFLYKLELTSEDTTNLRPIFKSLRFTINS